MQNDIRDQTEKAFYSDALPQFRSIDEIAEKAKATGTGLLTGTAALPSDAITIAEKANTFLADYANNPLAMLVKNNLQDFEKQYGRKAFDEGFEEITGVKSDPENTDQLIGEILSPTGAFLAPAKFIDRLSDGASTLYNTIKDTLSKSDFVKSDLVTEGVDLNKAVDVTKPIDDINKPKIDFNIIGKQSSVGKERIRAYQDAETKLLKDTGKEPMLRSDLKFSKGANKDIDLATEIVSTVNYDKLTQQDKTKLFEEFKVYRGTDGKLRTVISPKDATLKLDNLRFARETVQGDAVPNEFLDFSKLDSYPMRLRNMLNYEDLYRAYNKPIKMLGQFFQPIGNILIKEQKVDPNQKFLRGKTLASYDPAEDVIYLASGNADDVKRSLIHEIQHAVQNRENFENGTSILGILKKNNSNYVDRRKSLNTASKKMDDELFGKIDLVDEYMEARTKGMSPSNKKLYMQENSDPTSKYIQSVFAKEAFMDMVDKLAKREFQQVKSLGMDKIHLKVDTFHPMDANFTEVEEALANRLASNKDFINYMQLQTLAIQPEKRRLDELYNIAEQAYINKGGEAEARYAEMLIDYENAMPPENLVLNLDGVTKVTPSGSSNIQESVAPYNILDTSKVDVQSFVDIEDISKLDDTELSLLNKNIYKISDDFVDRLEKANLPEERYYKVDDLFQKKLKAFDNEMKARKKYYEEQYKKLDEYRNSKDAPEDIDTFIAAADDNATETILENSDNQLGSNVSEDELREYLNRGELAYDKYFFSSLNSVLADNVTNGMIF
tara:strand:- start:2900 stop:5242 length:2343 start_codon:yes stop_codon:yes gene_type:complete